MKSVAVRAEMQVLEAALKENKRRLEVIKEKIKALQLICEHEVVVDDYGWRDSPSSSVCQDCGKIGSLGSLKNSPLAVQSRASRTE